MKLTRAGKSEASSAPVGEKEGAARPRPETVRSLPEPRRKNIFLILVVAQDNGASVAESRAIVAKRFGVTEQQIRRVEQEGLDNQWPPL
jgi:hypothetical protein